MEECERCRKIMEKLHELEQDLQENKANWMIVKISEERRKLMRPNSASLAYFVHQLIAYCEKIEPNPPPLPEGHSDVGVDNTENTIKED